MEGCSRSRIARVLCRRVVHRGSGRVPGKTGERTRAPSARPTSGYRSSLEERIAVRPTPARPGKRDRRQGRDRRRSGARTERRAPPARPGSEPPRRAAASEEDEATEATDSPQTPVPPRRQLKRPSRQPASSSTQDYEGQTKEREAPLGQRPLPRCGQQREGVVFSTNLENAFRPRRQPPHEDATRESRSTARRRAHGRCRSRSRRRPRRDSPSRRRG
jgi:hypothetical protein